MKKFLTIDESEKSRILEMHQNAIKNHYLSEQGTQSPQTTAASTEGTKLNGKTYKIANIKDEASLNQFLNWGVLSRETAKGAREINLGMINTATGKALTKMPERTANPSGNDPYALVNNITNDLDLIAQNYTTDEVCKKSDKGLKLNNKDKSLEIAQQRVRMLGWCKQS